MTSEITTLAPPTVANVPNERENARDNMRIITIMLIATFVAILNETIMNVALTAIIKDFQISTSTAQWLATSYQLVMAILIPTTGFLMIRFTTRTLFLSAMGLFSLGTLVAAIAPTFFVVLLGRILQASGTALLLPLLTTTILTLIPVQQRGSVMGTISIVIAVAPALGPTISGFILESLSWRFVFIFILPAALGALAFGARKLKNVGELSQGTLDILSVILSALAFGGIVYGFSSAGENGSWSSIRVWLPLTISLISLTLFVWRQLTLASPLLDLRAFRYPMFSLSNGLMMLLMMVLFASALLLPIYLQNIRQFTPSQTGLLLLPGGVLMGVASPLIGRIFDRYGPRLLVIGGTLITTLVLWQFTMLTATTGVVEFLLLYVVFFGGLSMLFTPIFATGLNPLPRHLYSHGSAILSTLQQVAGAMGTALLVTVMTTSTQTYLNTAANPAAPDLQRAAQTAGLHAAFAVGAGLAFVALILALFVRRATPPEEPNLQGNFGDA